MIDLDGLEKDCSSAIDSGDGFVHLFSAEDVMGIITRLRQAEKDAARYRWLDEQNKSVMSKVMVCNGWIDDEDDVEYVSDLASFIDEAMQCK